MLYTYVKPLNVELTLGDLTVDYKSGFTSPDVWLMIGDSGVPYALGLMKNLVSGC